MGKTVSEPLDLSELFSNILEVGKYKHQKVFGCKEMETPKPGK